MSTAEIDNIFQSPELPVFEVSRYNYMVNRGNATVLYNARTGTFAVLSSEVAAQLANYDQISESENTSALLDIGAIHRGDEYEKLVELYSSGKPRGDTLIVTIVPTLECNRACEYCYQDEFKHSRHMSLEIQAAVVRYIESRVREGWKKVQITWYGGEPLVARDIVLSMTRSITAAVESSGGRISATRIVTNGVLLDEVCARHLVESGIRLAQVSFDSLFDNSVDQRGVLDCSNNPSLILNNIKKSIKILDISIRINVSKTNINDLPKILGVLEEHGLKKFAYLARVSDLEGESGVLVRKDGKRVPPSSEKKAYAVVPIIKADSNVLSRATFANLEMDQFLSDPNNLSLVEKKLTPKKHFCGATSENMFVIDPDGNVSRCWLSAGSESESIGNVLEEPLDHPGNEVEKNGEICLPLYTPPALHVRFCPYAWADVLTHDFSWSLKSLLVSQ